MAAAHATLQPLVHSKPQPRGPFSVALAPLLVLTGAALLLRLLRLGWQPLWWDEGYSIYFATEPFARMLALTARDIHPPLYYTLLAGWEALFGPTPPAARLLSALTGAAALPALAWLAHLFFPGRTRLHWIALWLLAANPFHLYYSQEVRMYSLALLLTILATALFWKVVRATAAGEALSWRPIAAYALLAALSLYTLYYSALVLLAHLLWALFVLRRRVWPHLAAAWAGAFLLYLPWLAYALPKLVGYVAQKVESDQDMPLGPLDWLGRHLAVFVGGHLTALGDWQRLWLVLQGGAALAALGLIGAALLWRRELAHGNGPPSPALDPVGALLTLLLFPAAAAFGLNLRLPFFPAGGERLMLFVLPFWILLIAAGAEVLQPRARVTLYGALGLLAAASLVGSTLFFLRPRHVEDDFRPLLRQVQEQSSAGDTFLALFPWMVGYWRAWVPADLGGAQPLLLSDGAVEYGAEVTAAVDAALQKGTLWFPEPLGFGSSLPHELESRLRATARNVENRWTAAATRLTAWSRIAELPPLTEVDALFGPLHLRAAAAKSAAAAGGAPLGIALLWDAPGASLEGVAVTLRLLDAEGRAWAARDYAPLAGSAPLADSATAWREEVGLLVPPATPPGLYRLFAGVSRTDERGESRLLPIQGSADGLLLAPLGQVTVALPPSPPSTARLPGMPLRLPAGRPLDMLTVSLPEAPVAAGDAFNMELFARAAVASPPLHELQIELEQRRGAGAVVWRGWPLPAWSTSLWQQGFPVRLPVSFHLPADLPAGQYTVSAAWQEPAGAESLPPLRLGTIVVTQRARVYIQPAGGVELTPAPLFGTHARLRAYTLERAGDQVRLGLVWEAQQPLLPPHHIFVHADVDDPAAPGGVRTVAQTDGPPLSEAGPAPTGAWLAGEFIVTTHRLTLPAGQGPVTLRVGLYNPQTQIRLPVAQGDTPAGDSFAVATLQAE